METVIYILGYVGFVSASSGCILCLLTKFDLLTELKSLFFYIACIGSILCLPWTTTKVLEDPDGSFFLYMNIVAPIIMISFGMRPKREKI